MMKIRSKKELLVEASDVYSILKNIGDLSHVLNEEEKAEQNSIFSKFTDWNDRLSDERYRVAIIGTEKAGKSTFANALLRRNFLPEDEGRCTFTTTTIESSKSEDIAEIHFFTKEEFKNKFDELCEEVEFKCSYNSVTLPELEKFCDTTSSAIATSNAIDDIRDIIEKKSEIEQYLTGKTQTFSGENIDDIKSYITDAIKARAVKNITIKSTRFKEQENLIIYDVPGFDSPTKLHLEQAKWYMNNADIVIMLVSIADRISFVKAQADFLNDTKDRYGQKLSNKLIVVASKFDKHIVDDKKSSDEKIDRSYKILIDELKKYGLYKENNIFKASALGFLEQESIVDSQYAYPNLKKHNYTHGINEIETRLEEFLNGEALEILNENYSIDYALAKSFLYNFKKNHNPKRDEKKKRVEEMTLIDSKWDMIKGKLESNLTKYQHEIKEQEYSFDDAISHQVAGEWIGVLKDSLEDEVEKAKTKIVSGRTQATQATKVNDIVRESIYKESLERIINISTDIISQENEKKQREILSIISVIFFETKDITNLEREDLNSILGEITENFNYAAKSYRPLILRFLNSVFEILILNRITMDEHDTRVEKFNILRSDIDALLNYDSEYDDMRGFYNQSFIKLLLIQDIHYDVKEPNIKSLLKGATVSTKYEDVIKEISSDLDSLGNIFNHILLKAINIEAPFKASINDQVQAVLNDLSENSKSELKKFLINNIESIARSEYSRLTIDENLAKQITNIIDKI